MDSKRLSDKVLAVLNKQINWELYSGYLYLSLSAYFEDRSFKGFARWNRIQAAEEVKHAMKIFDYVNARFGRVVLEQVQKPPFEFKSILDGFNAAFEHEKFNTSHIYECLAVAQAENDPATVNFLQWFVGEQVEEEEQAGEIVAKLEMLKEFPPALMFLDAKLGAREE
ncbi:MAG: ferritin [Candidatus Brocadiia bacterium]